MLLNIRGTHGSGKTYISHKLMDTFETAAVVEPEYVRGKHFVKTNCHIIGKNADLFIVGRYKSGMDGIFPQEIVEDMIKYWAPKGHVIWENIVVSANIGRWAELSRKLEPINHNIWLFLDTPLQVCIDRVMSRRAQAAQDGFNHRQDDAEVKLDVLAGHWRRVRRAAARAYLEGIDVRWVDHTCAYEQVFRLLVEEGGWEPSGTNAGIYAVSGNPLKTWEPTPDEVEYVLKTSKLPWGDPDEMTKVDYVSPAKSYKKLKVDALGAPVFKWGTNEEITAEKILRPSRATDIFGVEIKSWPGTISTVAETGE